MKKPTDEQAKKLTPEQYAVCIMGNTEHPFSGDLLNNHKEGKYHCVVCKQELFTSNEKFESGSGWPSFTDAVDKKNIELREDLSHNMVRTEVLCGNCGAHLGHMWEKETVSGMENDYYCINSVALEFEEEK